MSRIEWNHFYVPVHVQCAASGCSNVAAVHVELEVEHQTPEQATAELEIDSVPCTKRMLGSIPVPAGWESRRRWSGGKPSGPHDPYQAWLCPTCAKEI